MLTAAEPFGAPLGVVDELAMEANACTTVNLHPELLYAGATPQPHWEPVSARGWR